MEAPRVMGARAGAGGRASPVAGGLGPLVSGGVRRLWALGRSAAVVVGDRLPSLGGVPPRCHTTSEGCDALVAAFGRSPPAKSTPQRVDGLRCTAGQDCPANLIRGERQRNPRGNPWRVGLEHGLNTP